MSKKFVAFDIDGVLAEFEPALVDALVDKFGSKAFANRHLFSLEERFSKYPEIQREALKLVADPNFYYGLSRDIHALTFLVQLLEAGYGVMYVTSRPKSHENFTRRWLKKNAVYDGSLGLFCGVGDKADFLRDVDVEFLVDDNPSEIARCKKTGVPVLCWWQLWNDGIFPRLYVTNGGVLMLWQEEDKESVPFWLTKEMAR